MAQWPDFSGMSMFGGPIEPSADMRGFAANNYEMFRAHVNAGFTEDQAMQFLIGFMTAVVITGKPPEANEGGGSA